MLAADDSGAAHVVFAQFGSDMRHGIAAGGSWTFDTLTEGTRLFYDIAADSDGRTHAVFYDASVRTVFYAVTR